MSASGPYTSIDRCHNKNRVGCNSSNRSLAWDFIGEVAGCITDEVASAARGKTLGMLQHVRLVGFNQKEKNAFDRALKVVRSANIGSGRCKE